MIKFPCRCGHRFALDLEMAGGVIQCPKCSRLNDIPTLSDLNAILEDGTIDVRDEPRIVERGRTKELIRVFSPQRVDEAGNEIDLRNTKEDLAGVDGAIPLADEPAPIKRAPRPRYDPVTGELIRPIDVIKTDRDADPAEADIPVAKRALDYATGTASKRVGATSIAMELCRPMNMVVMSFIFLFHGYAFVSILIASFIFLPLLVAALVPFILVAHYANVIDEVGPCDHDELPRALRNLDWNDDLGGAFFALALGLFFGFAPWFATILFTWNLASDDSSALVINGLGLLVSLLITPALVMTTCTSGSIFNLRPDRVMSVASILGTRYVLLVLLGMATFLIYGLGTLGTNLPFLAYIFPVLENLFFLTRTVSITLLLVGIFLAHWFCWYVAVLYREHHLEFPWVNQRHVRVKSVNV